MVNKVTLIGNVGQDPEVRVFEKGSVARFSLATTSTWKDKNGDRQKETEWHSCEVWGNLVKVVESYVKKGSRLYVEGSIKTDTYKDTEGNERKATKIKVLNMTMMGDGGNASTPKTNDPVKTDTGVDFEADGDPNDLPF